MENVPFSDQTREIGKPSGWDDTLDGRCITISVHDFVDEQSGLPFMMTAWQPDAEELKALNEGKPIFLCISGRTHPVIKLYVND